MNASATPWQSRPSRFAGAALPRERRSPYHGGMAAIRMAGPDDIPLLARLRTEFLAEPHARARRLGARRARPGAAPAGGGVNDRPRSPGIARDPAPPTALSGE
jgi:hypothetical protein